MLVRCLALQTLISMSSLASVEADDLAGIDFFGWADEGGAAGFGVLECVRSGDTGFE